MLIFEILTIVHLNPQREFNDNRKSLKFGKGRQSTPLRFSVAKRTIFHFPGIELSLSDLTLKWTAPSLYALLVHRSYGNLTTCLKYFGFMLRGPFPDNTQELQTQRFQLFFFSSERPPDD